MYNSYQDIRGEKARGISQALGVDEPSDVAFTGYLVEVRKAFDHTRLSASASTYFREVLIRNDRGVEVIDIDKLKGEAVKTVYNSLDGTITSLTAPWDRNVGYKGDYSQTSQTINKHAEISEAWERFDGILMKAEPLLR